MHVMNLEILSFCDWVLLERQTGHHFPTSSAHSSLSTSSDHSSVAAAGAVGVLAATAAYVRVLSLVLKTSSCSLSSDQLVVLKFRSSPPSGSRAVSGDSEGPPCNLLAITKSPPRGSHAQAGGGVTAAVVSVVVKFAVTGAAVFPLWAEICLVVAVAAAELILVEFFCRHASRLILLLSLSGRLLPFLRVTLAAASCAAVLQ